MGGMPFVSGFASPIALDSTVVALSTSYLIQGEKISNDFKLLQLKGYDIILECD
jgi:hypothetical protein